MKLNRIKIKILQCKKRKVRFLCINFFIIALSLLGEAKSAGVPVTITGLDSITDTSYDEPGTLSQLAQLFNAQGEAGHTTWDLSASYFNPINYSLEDCVDENGVPNGKHKVVVADSNLELTIPLVCSKDMPNWVNKSQHPQSAQQEWDRFYAALDDHENGHISILKGWFKDVIVQKYVKDIRGESKCFTGSPTQSYVSSATQAALKQAQMKFVKFKQDYEAAQKKYDADTNHGATPPPGAVLDGSKEP